MTSRCAVCGAENNVIPESHAESIEPPDFDTRPGEPLRSTISTWVQCCDRCGYCAADISVAHSKAHEVVGTDSYEAALENPDLPEKVRHFLAYACLLDKMREHADAGWSSLHGAWVCDDEGNFHASRYCREQAIEYWKRGKHAGQAFSDDLASEYALVADLHRRMGQFELAMVTCSEALDMDDLPPVIEHVLRRQKTLIEQRDVGGHSIRELLVNAPVQ
jgi:hypothetical protein